MAVTKLFPKHQQYLDLRNGTTIGIHTVKIITGGAGNTDFLSVGASQDVAILQSDRLTADPSFYLSGNNASIVNIDAATAGTEYVVVTKHSGSPNFIVGDPTDQDNTGSTS